MEKTKKIMSIQGGGIKDVAFLTFLLNLSQYYDKKNIDLLSLFDVFSGVSSGSIIATAFALREQFLKNMATVNPQIIREALIKLAYSEAQIVATIIALKNMSIKNCSTITIATMIYFYENLSPEIFFRTTLRKIVSLHRRRFKMRQNGLKIKYYNILTMNSKRPIMTCSVQKTLSFELKRKVCKADFSVRAVPAFLL